MKDGADELYFQIKTVGLTGWNREYRFHPTRKWRVDLVHCGFRVAVEVEGFGVRGTGGRHQRISGFSNDCEKYAELAIAGWRLIRVTTKHVKSGVALQWIERAIK
jgi:very-short-patch-repair endonuclease